MEASAHEKISKNTMEILKKFYPKHTFATFYAGNWLTDMSQVVAPVDFAEMLVDKHQEAQDGSPNIHASVVTAAFKGFVYDAFGDTKTIDTDHSKFVSFMTNVMYNNYCLKFILFCSRKSRIFKN